MIAIVTVCAYRFALYAQTAPSLRLRLRPRSQVKQMLDGPFGRIKSNSLSIFNLGGVNYGK